MKFIQKIEDQQRIIANPTVQTIKDEFVNSVYEDMINTPKSQPKFYQYNFKLGNDHRSQTTIKKQ